MGSCGHSAANPALGEWCICSIRHRAAGVLPGEPQETPGICSEYFSKDINILPWHIGITPDFLLWFINAVQIVQIKYHSKLN